MDRIEITNLTPKEETSGLTPQNVSAVHQALSAEERKDLACLRVTRDEDGLARLNMKFKNKNVSVSGTDAAVVMEGDYTAKDVDSLMRVTSSLGWKSVAVNAGEKDKQNVWSAVQETGQELQGVLPDEESVKKYAAEMEKIAPVGEFFANAKQLTVHDGVSRDEKNSPAARFLKKVMQQPKKIYNAFKYGLNKTKKLIADIYDFNENPAVKVLAAVGTTALGGSAALTVYMAADKAHWAYDLMMERRAEEKARKEKVAEFMAKGLEVPKELTKKKFLYEQRPWIKMAGHLSVRLGGTALLAAQYGPWSGAAFIGAIVIGKALYNAHILQDAVTYLPSGRKNFSTVPKEERREKAGETLIKSAVFTSVAAMGLGYFDPSAVPGVSIGPTRWTGVDKMREFKKKIQQDGLPVPDLLHKQNDPLPLRTFIAKKRAKTGKD